MSTEPNATFHSFKRSGKWYATGRGHLSPAVYKIWDDKEVRKQIERDNGNAFPGLAGASPDFVYVVIPDESCPHGWPLMLGAVRE